MKGYYVEWADIKADCQYDHDNEGLVFGIHWEDDDGDIVNAEWFKTEEERFEAIMLDNPKKFFYKGHYIRVTDFAMYEVYGDDRFYKFDTIEGLEAFVDSLEVH